MVKRMDTGGKGAQAREDRDRQRVRVGDYP